MIKCLLQVAKQKYPTLYLKNIYATNDGCDDFINDKTLDFELFISFTSIPDQAKKFPNKRFADDYCDKLNLLQPLSFTVTNHSIQKVKRPSKSLSEEDIKQKDEFYESQNNIPCKDCKIGLKERSIDGCASCINDENQKDWKDIKICKECSSFGNPDKCPQKDPDHVSYPAAEPIIRPCDTPGSEVTCDKCPDNETCRKHDI